MRLARYRVLRPLHIHGRVAGTGEVVRLPEYAALEWVESGHLREINAVLLNGSGEKWAQPMTRGS